MDQKLMWTVRRIGVLLLAFSGVSLAYAQAGIVVREVTRYDGADRAGVPVGAVLEGWSTADRPREAFDSWLDVRLVELTQALDGPVTLYGSVDGLETSWTLDLIRWGLHVAPAIPGLDDLNDLASVERALTRPTGQLNETARIWLELERAELLEAEDRSEEADRAFETARSIATDRGHPSELVVVADVRGESLFDGQQFERARDAYLTGLVRAASASLPAIHLKGMAIRQAFYTMEITEAIPELEALLELISRAAPRSLLQARYQNWLAQLYGLQGEDAKEEALVKDALALQRALGPQDVSELAHILDVRGWVAKKQGRWEEAILFSQEAVDIATAHMPHTFRTASLQHNLGSIYQSLGDLETAELWMRRALESFRRDQLNFSEIYALAHLALIAVERGRLIEAESLAERSVELAEKHGSNTPWESPGLRALSEVALRRGDLETARAYSERALAPLFAEWSTSEETTEELIMHANILREQGETEVARDLVAEILAKRETAEGPRDLDAQLRMLLGHVELDLGNASRAEALWGEALELHTSMAPTGPRTAMAHALVADAALRRGDLEDAETSIEAGLEIATAVLPGSLTEAELWSLDGQLAERRGRARDGLASYCRSRDAAELQREVAGGSDLHQSHLADRLQSYYGDCLRLYAEHEDAAAAFAVFEQSRGRVLRSLMGRREVDWGADLDVDTRERLHEARRKVSGTRLRLEGLASDSRELAEARAELTAARNELADAEAAALQHTSRRGWSSFLPAANVEHALAELPDNAVFVGYSIGEDAAWVLVAGRPHADGARDLQVRKLDANRATLEKLAATFLGGLDPAALAPIETLDQLGADLYTLLLSPIEDLLPRDTELILSPDVPLLELPFAALMRPARGDARSRYLVEEYPLHYLDSLSMATRRHGPASTDGVVLGLADPAGHGSDVLQELGVRGAALPGARREVEALGDAFPTGSRTLMGAAATEATLYQLAPAAEIVHFATHGVYDPGYPLASWLLLSPGDGEDGRLEAWEIVERLRTDARLVTLSACESARGQAYAGEGLIGLTRALHIAGAGTVLASTWRIGDRSTARLMADFYRELAAGIDPAEALRRAQVAAIRSGSPRSEDTARGVGGLAARPAPVHPFYWAAFRLSG